MGREGEGEGKEGEGMWKGPESGLLRGPRWLLAGLDVGHNFFETQCNFICQKVSTRLLICVALFLTQSN